MHTHTRTFACTCTHTHTHTHTARAAKELMRAAEMLSHGGRAKVRRMWLVCVIVTCFCGLHTHTHTSAHAHTSDLRGACNYNRGHCSRRYDLSCCVMTGPNLNSKLSAIHCVTSDGTTCTPLSECCQTHTANHF